MPEMDGIAVTGQLRELGYKAPVVALTANAVSGQADVFLKSGFDEFISKPIDIRHLNQILNKLIRDRHPPEVVEAARRSCKGAIHGAPPPAQTNSLLIESFVRDALKVIAMLQEQNQNAGWLETEANLQKFTIMVHGIKSSLRNINETKLSEFAYKLEIAGRERDIDVITSDSAGFLNELCMLLEKIKAAERESGEDGEIADEDVVKLAGKLREIQKKCADYNRRGALELLAEIKNCSKATKAVLDSIKEYVLHSDFNEAESAAEAYASDLLCNNAEMNNNADRF
jgi:CheY-like chemotaxis protein